MCERLQASNLGVDVRRCRLDGLQIVAFLVRAGGFEYGWATGVCKTDANAFGIDSLPANAPRSVRFWRRFAVDNYPLSAARLNESAATRTDGLPLRVESTR